MSGDPILEHVQSPAHVSYVLGPAHVGLWRYSRHPNHVGEQMFWWGLAIFAISSGDFWTLIGPLFNTICMVRLQHMHIAPIVHVVCLQSVFSLVNVNMQIILITYTYL